MTGALRGVRWWLVAAAGAALLLATVHSGRERVAAQEPIVGAVPTSGVAFLVAAVESTPAELAAALEAQDCVATTIAVTEAGVWQVYVPGAPDFVNASFPSVVGAGRAFAALCMPTPEAAGFVHFEARGPGTGAVATLSDARAGAYPGFDRLVVEFADEAMPSYQIDYVTGPQYTCGAGLEVTSAGSAWLRINLTPAEINDEQGQMTIPSRTLEPGLPMLLGAEEICGFEGQVIWLLGLAEQRAFRVSLLSQPARLVVDVPHASSDPSSGVSGIALAGPQCPVMQQGVPCPDMPVDVELAFRQVATTVATVQTGADGLFSVDLPTGVYYLTTTGSVFPSLAPQEVTVPVDGHVWLELRLDTGIR